MASRFIKAAKAQEAEIERLIEERDGGTPVSYSMMQSLGQLKPFAVRLPITTIAQLDLLQRYGLWSKQEMVYEMIESAVSDYYASQGEEVRATMDKAATDALEAWNKKHKGKAFDPRRGKWVGSELKVPRKRERK